MFIGYRISTDKNGEKYFLETNHAAYEYAYSHKQKYNAIIGEKEVLAWFNLPIISFGYGIVKLHKFPE
jgi:hypothetical protein